MYNMYHTMFFVHITYTAKIIPKLINTNFTRKTNNKLSCSFTTIHTPRPKFLCGYKASLVNKRSLHEGLQDPTPRVYKVLMQGFATEALQRSPTLKRLNKKGEFEIQ